MPHHILSFYSNLEENNIREDTKYCYVGDFATTLKKQHYTQKAFVELSAVSVGTIKSLRMGNNVNQTTANKICVALELPLDKLFKPVSENSKLSSASVHYHHRVLSTILSTAVEWQIIPFNPCKRVKPPKNTKQAPKYLDDKQVIKFFECLESEPIKYQIMFKCCVFLGLRNGELMGLEWKDIDFQNNVIHIRRESLYLSSKGIYTEDGKTSMSKRTIKGSSALLLSLKAYKAEQAKERLKLGDRWINSDRLFVKWNGEPAHPDSFRLWLSKFTKKNDLTKITPHKLRHTNASLLIANGTPITTVAKRLGHANAAITGTIYAHAIQSADEIAADTLNDILVNCNKA